VLRSRVDHFQTFDLAENACQEQALSSLQRKLINYDCKKFYNIDPRSLVGQIELERDFERLTKF
jgi:hypothetical protein